MRKKRKPADTEEKSLDELLADAKTVPDEEKALEEIPGKPNLIPQLRMDMKPFMTVEKALDEPEHCKVHDLPGKPIEEIILDIAKQLHGFIKMHNARLVKLSGDNIACGRTVRYFSALDCDWDQLNDRGLEKEFMEQARSILGTLVVSEKKE